MAVTCPKCRADNPETVKFCGECGTSLPPKIRGHVPDSPESGTCPPNSKDVYSNATETLQSPVRELATGSTFAGRYQIIEELGHGGMGRVYKVQDTDIKEKVALKLLRPEITLDKETVERFSNELKLARKISHRNVCRMFDLGRAEGTTFITMEFVPGEDLKSFIHRSKQLNIGTALSIAKQVCAGLEEAHRLGVIHRDLKPGNIMIDKDGDAKIMDFGIARSLSGRGITGAGVLIGTPEYMSPEQVEGKDVDQRSDIYSLGVILYEMVTGRLPFAGDTPLSVAHKHKYEAPEDPKKLNAQLPDDLARVILKCLAKDKDKRFQSAAELGTELGRIEKGLPTTEPIAPERVTPTRKPFTSKEITVKFQPKKIIIPALAVVAVITAAIIFWPKKVSNLNPNIVAVAVFENKTGDPKLDPIGSMAAERIMQGLSQVGQFNVAPMPTAQAISAAARGKDTLRALADLTKAGKIVYGDYYLQGDTIQFHAWVQDMAAKKNIISCDPAGGPLQDPAAALEPLRLRLMGGLAIAFNPALKSYLNFAFRPTTFEGYREFMDGTNLFVRRNYKDSIEHFLRSAESDPKFSLALLYAATAYMNLGQYAKADEQAQKMEKLRPELSTFERVSLDWLQASLRGDNETVLRLDRQQAALTKAYEWIYLIGNDGIVANYPQGAVAALSQLDPYDPNHKDWSPYWRVLSTAHHMLGNYKQELNVDRRARKLFPNLISLEVRPNAALGRMNDLEKLFEECKTLSSVSLGSVMLIAGRELRAHGFREESVRVLDRARQWFEGRPEQEQGSIGNRSDQALTLYILGKWAEAKDLYAGLRKDYPNTINYWGYLGAVDAHMGNREGAVRISKQLEEDKRPYLFGSPTAWRARIAALLGDKEGAVNLLRKATGEGYSFMSLHADVDFESLADFPPYIQLMKPKG